MIKGSLLNHRYQVLHQIGQGGMSDVYLAKDIKRHRMVAIKVLRLDFRDDERAQNQFNREAVAISHLDSPNIVKVYAVKEYDGIQYLVMEYVQGTNLKEYIHRHPTIPVTRVIRIMDQILTAVNVAHQNNIVHRDLKPENVLIDARGNVKITDFGIAIISSEKTLTQTNSIVGSIHYLSPEQARGDVATKQSDIYSLGIIMYELLTNHVPFDGESAVAIAIKHSREPFPSIQRENPQVPVALENVVMQATAKNPADRFQTIAQMKANLDAAMEQPDAVPFVPRSSNSMNDETKVMNADAFGAINQSLNASGETTGAHHQGRVFWYTWVASAATVCVAAIVMFKLFVVQVPSVSGLTRNQAISRLKQAGLQVDQVKYVYADNVAINQVVKTTPANHQWVLRNHAVRLVLSNGVDKIALNNYIGQDFAETARQLENEGFTVTKKLASSDTFAAGKVLGQNFTPGNSYSPRNKTIQFVVSDGVKQFTMKRLVGLSKEAALEYVRQMGLNPTLDYQYNDDYASGIVFNQNPDSGLTVYNGDNIIISVSKGDKTGNSRDSNAQHTLNVNVNLPYQPNTAQSNLIKIYVKDNNNSIDHLYRAITIYQDTKFIIPFKLGGKQPGEYRIVRDGKTISDVKNIN